MKQKVIIVLSVLGIALLCNFYLKNTSSDNNISKNVVDKTLSKAEEIKSFLKKNSKYNKDVFFLLDMRIPSNKFRFFVYDTKKNKITDSGLVAHGSGSATATGELQFSNTDGSLMTSLGKYYIGNSYNGTFGKAYKMYGLDTTNSNAYLRNIVLHSHKKMPYAEQISPIVLSWGCPMLNEKFYLRIQDILDKSDKNILMYIYY
ncbi:murein L,D-transpeptidase catalytic domain-containing protein [Flavobacterium terrigena]|uniref:L,D-transpeptidase catalytic domain n=1 Tax=Flavobacterium terrigena TaxID=402734 RepID=A0A1H6RLF6_9FLAO|nr:murein L,D-transpeptidase catalytic domain family protein [Flavobacterium terrigena]SEI56638.1 L,D-transpeptidase catalytic domain [Flavobacterium terrigena]